jgi:hypothetical protein
MPYSGPHEDEEIALDEEEQDPLATNEPNQVFELFLLIISKFLTLKLDILRCNMS